MVQYNFKEICIIPTASEFIDIVLSKTQRKTPTVVHRRYRISSIRQFYMRKVKFCAATIKERLGGLLSSFPRVDSIHPFYADLMHVLYDKDHYKLALGQLNATRNVVEKICKDYIKLLKFSDSLYRSKQLKRAAMGRMCTALKKLDISLKYLEEVRQHLSRLPSIDPAARTLILAGYPNVGKSSFVNKVSRADVEVQPYAFTTKSLFVGHFFHEYLRWQVIDTPGVLDHPPQELSGCNTIEMQAVTAIAHIQASVLFFVDLSPSCEYSVEQQLRLFEFLRPVFVAKPVVFVASKSDLRTFRDLPPREKGLIEQTLAAHKIPLVELSNLSEDGVIAARDKACALLLEARLARKLDSGRGAAVKARLAITRPSPRDHKARPPSIPVSVAAEKLQPRPKKPTVHEMQEMNGGGGVFSVSLREHWDLRDPAWATHSVPEIFEGQNVSDWMDPDIEAKLDKLEREERAAEDVMRDDSAELDLDEDQQELYAAVFAKTGEIKAEAFVRRTQNKPRPNRAKSAVKDTTGEMARKLAAIGYQPAKAVSRIQRDGKLEKRKNRVKTDFARERNELAALAEEHGLSFEEETRQKRMSNRAIRKSGAGARSGGTGRVLTSRPKHLFSGKRKLGKTNRR